MLLRQSADIKVRNYSNLTPDELTKQKNSTDMEELLHEWGVKQSSIGFFGWWNCSSCAHTCRNADDEQRPSVFSDYIQETPI